jgi:hypothetical protein
MQAGKLAEACEAFDRSQQLDPRVTTLLNLADCREQNHQLATAWGTFVDANRMARTGNDDKLARVATTHARKLESRISKLTIAVPADHQLPGLEVQRGSDRVDPAGWNHALPIDGGTYTITARAPGRTPWSTTRTIKLESDAQTVEVPKLSEARPAAFASAHAAGAAAPAPAAAAPPAGAASSAKPGAGSPGMASSAKPGAGSPGMASSAKPGAGNPGAASSAKPSAGNPGGARSAASPAAGGAGDSSAARADAGSPGGTSPVVGPRPAGAAPRSSVADSSTAPADPPAPEPPEGRSSHALPLVVGAGAVVLAGASLGFDLSGDSLYDQAKASLDQASRSSRYGQANTRRYLAEGFGVAALGLAGAAVYLYLRGGGDSRAEAAAVTPVASPQLTGLAVVGSW